MGLDLKVIGLINSGQATLADFCEWHDAYGYEFVIEDGVIVDVLHR